MPKKKIDKNDRSLRLVSSGTKIWNQFMMFLVIGILPIVFPSLIQVSHRLVVFVIVTVALLTSLAFEIIRSWLEKKGRDFKWVVDAQLLTSAVLLTFFLHFFGRINGPFFVLYLLTVMESFLNRNIFLSNIVVGIMIFTTGAEFGWLVFQKEIIFGFIPLVGLVVRILSLIFMRAYGNVLAQKIAAEEESKKAIQESAKRLEKISKELKKANVRLEELSALKDEFISVASHELRAPMTTIKGYIAMILEGDAGKVPSKVKEFLGSSYESNERMIRLVNNMLNVSRIESGQLIIGLADIYIEEVISSVIKEYQLEAKQHGLKLIYDQPETRLPKVRVDPDRIREVVANLVGNAINFTPHGSVTAKSYLKNGMVMIEVADTGVGISEHDQKQLFKKFSQIAAGTPLKKGSGLGLYICRLLITQFGGKIWLDSKPGKGTTFFFSLPPINHNP